MFRTGWSSSSRNRYETSKLGGRYTVLICLGRVGPPLQEIDMKLVNWEEGGYTVVDQQGPRGEIHIGK